MTGRQPHDLVFGQYAGMVIGSSHRVLLHTETRELAEHRGERTRRANVCASAASATSTLHSEVSTDVNSTQRRVDWQMSTMTQVRLSRDNGPLG